LTLIGAATPVKTAPVGTFGFGSSILPDGSTVFMAGGAGVSAIDPATLAATPAGPGIDNILSVGAAVAPPCWFEATPQQSYVRSGGGTVTIDVPAPAGCAWSLTVSDNSMLVPTPAAGTGPGSVTFTIAASGAPRRGLGSIGLQTLVIDQVVAQTIVDTPTNGAVLALPFDLSGWAIERDADGSASSSGVDYIDLWDQTGIGSGPVYIRRLASAGNRPDIAAAYGERYRQSGFSQRIGRLPAGTRTLVAYAHSAHDGSFNAAPVTVTIVRTPTVVIDAPGGGDIAQPFRLYGWAADMTAPSGTGVDLVHVHAHPLGGGSPIFVGAATTGVNRADVGTHFNDPQAYLSGFELNVTSLPPGRYRLVVSARCTTTGTFDATASVEVTVDNPPLPAPPIGVVDTPVAGAAVEGAIGVTGWALDDTGVAKVSVFRDPVDGEGGLIFVGDATFVEGARPDVAAAFPNYPNKTRGGWGLMVLTNMLPGGGNGMFTFHVEAYDHQGNVTLLGRRTIIADNAGSVLPFGAIDTPPSGAPVSGTMVVFGWALTPAPAIVPLDGSTIDVLIDGVVVGQPTFNQCRGTNTSTPPVGTCDDDIATIFGSTYRNIAEGRGAIGSFLFDTTTLSNGIHTIEWRVTDSAGRVQGIGSRFFVVDNP
jgi:hypothetical protein